MPPSSALPLQDRADGPAVFVEDKLTLAGERLHDRPVEGLIEADRPTESVNPFRPVNVRVKLAKAPARTVALVGLMEMAKSAGAGTVVIGPNFQVSPRKLVPAITSSPPKRRT